MKNIHLIPTDKPSRLFEIDGHLIINKEQLIQPKYYRNIYITSDEEIKEEDWFLVELFKITGESNGLHIEKCIKLDDVWCNNFDVISTRHKDNCKKIILTTDQDLIKDGVQAIDDEFLEWFVKNPSCEFVEVVIMNKGYNKIEDFPYQECYKIIIPQEEPKQETLELPVEINFANEIEQISEYDKGRWYGRIEGAKWQADRMYSEEDMQEYAEFCVQCFIKNLPCIIAKDWFTQFKK